MADSKEQGRRAAQKAQADYERNIGKARDSRRKGFERAQKAGLSLREIGEAVELHWTTVRQILKGKTINDRAYRAWAAWNKKEKEAAEGESREPRELQPITLHECRHTFASLLIDAGVNPKAIQEFMGHATIEETFSRYGHLMPGARKQARALVDAYIAAALKDGPPEHGC